MIAKSLLAQARELQAPDGSTVSSLTVAQIEQLAGRYGVSTRLIEIIALENNVIPLRYARNFNATSLEDQIRLLNATIAVIGLGGLGGAVVEILARAGVGALNLADGDAFEDHNLNRQLFSTQEILGLSKAKAARDRVRSINASVDVTIFDFCMTAENVARILVDCQAVVDCLDNIPTRLVLHNAARQAGIPMVSAAVAGATAHITTLFPEDDGLDLIYGPAESLKSEKGAETTLGCLPQSVILTASIECAEVLKLLQGKVDHLLRNKLLVVDLEDNTFETLRLK
ncbi:MAG: ThiF family adenylyltransferase [Desulfosarcinaceae bacterium]